MQIQTHIEIYIYTYTNLHMSIHTFFTTFVLRRMRSNYTDICICTHTSMYIHTQTHAHTCKCIIHKYNTYMGIETYLYINTQTHVHIHRNTHFLYLLQFDLLYQNHAVRTRVFIQGVLCTLHLVFPNHGILHRYAKTRKSTLVHFCYLD